MVMSPYTSDNVLVGDSIIFWESVTRSHIEKHLLRSGVDPPLLLLQKVGTNIVGQNIPVVASPGDGRRLRRLQDNRQESAPVSLSQDGDDSSLIIVFDVAVSFRSESQELDVRALIYSAWDSPDDRAEYVQALQAESNVFSEINDARVEVEGFRPPTDDNTGDGGGDSESIGIAVIAGASVGGVALLFLIGFFIMRRQNGSKSNPHRQQDSKTTPETGSRIAVST